jgi:hypothetical protein
MPNRRFLSRPMHIPRVTTMSCPGQSPVDTQQNLAPFKAMTMSRPSHTYMGVQQQSTISGGTTMPCPGQPPANVQQNLAPLDAMTMSCPSDASMSAQQPVTSSSDMTMSCPGYTFRQGIESTLAPVFTPRIPKARPDFRFGYRLANAQGNLDASHVPSSAQEGQHSVASKVSCSTRKRDLNYRKRDLWYLTPNEHATNQMIDNFNAFLHAEIKVFAQVLPSGKASVFEQSITTAMKTINSLKFSPNDPIGNLTTNDLRYSTHIYRKKNNVFASKAIKKVKTPKETKVPNQPLRIFGKVPPECSAAVKHIKQELQDNPNNTLSNTPIHLPKEDSNVTTLKATLSSSSDAQLNSPSTPDIIDIITLDDLDTNITNTWKS